MQKPGHDAMQARGCGCHRIWLFHLCMHACVLSASDCESHRAALPLYAPWTENGERTGRPYSRWCRTPSTAPAYPSAPRSMIWPHPQICMPCTPCSTSRARRQSCTGASLGGSTTSWPPGARLQNLIRWGMIATKQIAPYVPSHAQQRIRIPGLRLPPHRRQVPLNPLRQQVPHSQ